MSADEIKRRIDAYNSITPSLPMELLVRSHIHYVMRDVEIQDSALDAIVESDESVLSDIVNDFHDMTFMS
jgi:hypothetical protein